jgi:acyl carrier protein
LARGYCRRPDLTAEKFIANPFGAAPGDRLYKTGDLARYLSDGRIAFLGRADEQIKIRGFRIEPNEIVSRLDKHPSVQASAVLSRENKGDKRLVAYVVPNPNSEPTAGVLKEFLGAQLPEYMIPAVFVGLDSLPVTTHGKIDRAALPEPNTANSLRNGESSLPRTPIEIRLAELMATLLGIEPVGANDNFFLLGGHSLLGTQLIARVRNAFGVELTLRSLFDNPTIAAIAAQIERLGLSKESAAQQAASQRLPTRGPTDGE